MVIVVFGEAEGIVGEENDRGVLGEAEGNVGEENVGKENHIGVFSGADNIDVSDKGSCGNERVKTMVQKKKRGRPSIKSSQAGESSTMRTCKPTLAQALNVAPTTTTQSPILSQSLAQAPNVASTITTQAPNASYTHHLRYPTPSAASTQVLDQVFVDNKGMVIFEKGGNIGNVALDVAPSQGLTSTTTTNSQGKKIVTRQSAIAQGLFRVEEDS
ncbi:uncharacterized protein A4U43_C03F23650 [Asparagus officinalis]|uniref:Uncharacterized protein n=1 Tax=Asparagus officinalis TaxID=4686 RepID=A0A5P1FCI7_ASPOF|nr:uncharacterized protein A4U43_C03F23650 [Asparagus officinalis]